MCVCVWCVVKTTQPLRKRDGWSVRGEEVRAVCASLLYISLCVCAVYSARAAKGAERQEQKRIPCEYRTLAHSNALTSLITGVHRYASPLLTTNTQIGLRRISACVCDYLCEKLNITIKMKHMRVRGCECIGAHVHAYT